MAANEAGTLARLKIDRKALFEPRRRNTTVGSLAIG
jgi:hypothetical protein